MSSKNARSRSGHSPLGESNERMQIEILRIRDCHRTGITCRLRTCLYRSSSITLAVTTRLAFLWMISRVKNPLASPIHPSRTIQSAFSVPFPPSLPFSSSSRLKIISIIPTCRAETVHGILRVLRNWFMEENFFEYTDQLSILNVNSLISY